MKRLTMRALAEALRPGDEVVLSGQRYRVESGPGGRIAVPKPKSSPKPVAEQTDV